MKILLRSLAITAIFLAILLAAGFFVLKRGIDINEFTFSNIEINQIHLKWDEKLNLGIQKIAVQPAKEKSSGKFDPAQIRSALHAVEVLEDWFTSFRIDQILVGPLTARFQYHDNTGGLLNITSPQAELNSSITIVDGILVVDIEKLNAPEFNSHANGEVRVDADNSQLTATIETMVADTLPIHLEVNADSEQLSFSGYGKQSVASIAPIVELFNLSPNISPWITDNLKGSQISLTSVSGSIPYDDPASILQTLHAVANVQDTEYTFAQGLEPIKAKETDVEFKKAILKIKPHEATFYNQDAGNSELDINFNDGKAILSAYIKTRAQASGGILTLLEHYGIPFPFEQKEGLTDTDLTLAIDLNTVDIDAKGTFKADNSVFEFDQQLIDVGHLDIGLNRTDIKIHQLDISKQDQFSARISGDLDTAKGQGDLQASINKFSQQFGETTLLLVNPDKAPLNMKYHMSNDGDSISAPASTWTVGDIKAEIGYFTTPFDHETWSGKLPPTTVNLIPLMKTKVSGTFSRQPPYADLDISLVELTHENLRLDQPEIQMELVIGDDISLTTKDTTHFSTGNTTIKLSPSHMTYGGDKLHIHQSGLDLPGQFSSDITGQLDFNNKTGSLTLDQLEITDKTDMNVLAVEKPVPVKVSLLEDRTHAEIPMLGVEFKQHDKGSWSLDLKDFGKLYPHSPLMQQYKLQDGELNVTSHNGSLPWTFSSKFTYPHALLVDSDKPVHDYRLNGTYDGDATTLDINEKVHVVLADKVSITSSDIGYNVPALINISKEQKKTSEVKKTTQDAPVTLSLNATNSFLILAGNRRALADELNVTIENGVVSGDLKYNDGSIYLQYKDDTVSLIGKELKQQFLNELITLSDFDKGKMEFKISGSLGDIDGVVRINDAIIKNFKSLNNMLAFVNTVPALLTFKLPDYSRKGLPAREISVGFNYSKGIIKLESLNIDSDELDLRGEGEANFNDDSIDMTFNMITGAKKSVGRIPLLGYVLSGDKKKPTITLTVKGNLHDPEVKNTAFKEVAAYPFDVLKNTVTLPGHLLKKTRQKPSNGDIDDATDASMH